MSEGVIIALVGFGSSVIGAGVAQFAASAKNRLEAYRLAQDMQVDNQRLWQWNRALVDHIYKGLGPPPPPPPVDLFGND